MKTQLPKPSPEALKHSDALREHICASIDKKGLLSFEQYMNLALYAPTLGYYTAGSQKFGKQGDFVTAPEISELFGHCLANQFEAILKTLETPIILELGAGSGRLALDILTKLKENNALPNHYYILEVSADLKAKQKNLFESNAPEFLSIITWLNALPNKTFNGIIFGNEVIDALPMQVFEIDQHNIYQRTITHKNGQFAWDRQPATDQLLEEVKALNIENASYISEIQLNLKPWLAGLTEYLNQGVLLFIDYGFSEKEYYHPQRSTGTLMCHYRHHAHTDPFLYPGLQDITAHVDFTAVAIAADDLSLEVLGYTTQADFLLQTGIAKFAEKSPGIKTSQAVQTLTFPHEMGELFKVIALGKNFDQRLCGFQKDDQYKL